MTSVHEKSQIPGIRYLVMQDLPRAPCLQTLGRKELVGCLLTWVA